MSVASDTGCSCTKGGCTARCKCLLNNRPCTIRCKCRHTCKNPCNTGCTVTNTKIVDGVARSGSEDNLGSESTDEDDSTSSGSESSDNENRLTIGAEVTLPEFL